MQGYAYVLRVWLLDCVFIVWLFAVGVVAWFVAALCFFCLLARLLFAFACLLLVCLIVICCVCLFASVYNHITSCCMRFAQVMLKLVRNSTHQPQMSKAFICVCL